MAREKVFSSHVSQDLQSYLEQTFQPENKILESIRERSLKKGLPSIQVSALDGRILQFFVSLLKPKCVVEFGTLGGYSALCMAQALGEGAKLYTFEKNPIHASTARENIERSGFESQISVIEGDALHNLKYQELTPQIVFIDADKSKYIEYYEWAVENLSPGGLIIADNTLAFGSVHLPLNTEDPRVNSIRALKAYNERVTQDPRVFSILIPTGEGMTLSIKKTNHDSH